MNAPGENAGTGPTPDEWEQHEEWRRSKWQETFGAEPLGWKDEALAPPIDGEAAELLRAYLLTKLPLQQELDVLARVWSFRSWAEALLRTRAALRQVLGN